MTLQDLALLLRDLRPQLREGEWVFVTAARPPEGVEPLASFMEDEGPSWVVRREQADSAGLPYDFVAAWITLTVHSAVGCTVTSLAVREVREREPPAPPCAGVRGSISSTRGRP